MPSARKIFLLFVLFTLAFAGGMLTGRQWNVRAVSVAPTASASPAPSAIPSPEIKIVPFADDPLKDSILAAGDYLIRQQLSNGELSYQVDFFTGERAYIPSHVRLAGGAGTLFTVCRVSADMKYCNAGDLALDHYLELLLSDPASFKGTCFYAEGTCQLGGAALVIDTIYKRWQAAGEIMLYEHNLLNTAIDIGYFIVSMRKPNGGFYHAFDPHIGGVVDSDFFAAYSSSASVLALLQLYEMTGGGGGGARGGGGLGPDHAPGH